MKKLFGALIAGSLMFGAVFASASTLNVSGGTIQAGSIMDVSCQTDAVVVSYNTQLNGAGVNEVKSVTLSGIDGACYGKWADIALITNIVLPPGSGVTATNVWGTLAAAPSTTFAISGTLPLSSAIKAVHVQIKDAS